MLSMLILALVGQAPPARPAAVPDVRQLSVATPTVLAEVDTKKVHGEPIGLAWNEDGTIYLRVTQGPDNTRHYKIATVPAISFTQSDSLPAWAAAYWFWKSGMVAPGDPSLKIDVEQRKENLHSTNTSRSMGGVASVLGGSGGQGMAQNTANTNSLVDVVTMRFKGQVVGEWINETPQPGMRFGWAPAPMGVLAYTPSDGRLVLIDRDGHKQPVPGAIHALLPAWSLDGKQILFLQKKSSRLYLLMVAAVR
jgi:hypothetical protein